MWERVTSILNEKTRELTKLHVHEVRKLINRTDLIYKRLTQVQLTCYYEIRYFYYQGCVQDRSG